MSEKSKVKKPKENIEESYANPNGRPPIETDLKQAELFGKFKATHATMAEWYGCCTKTIDRLMSPSNEIETKFCLCYKKGLSSAKMTLSEAQFRNATENDNATMQVWLGKQMLNQTDKQEIESKNLNLNTEVPEDQSEEVAKAVENLVSKL